MDGRDINGAFPGDPNGSVTEVLAHYLFSKIIVPKRIITSISGVATFLNPMWFTVSIQPMQVTTVNRISKEMSRACGYEYYQARMPNPGSLGL